eukprot:6303201-Pyramimonas_sp.AAC.3
MLLMVHPTQGPSSHANTSFVGPLTTPFAFVLALPLEMRIIELMAGRKLTRLACSDWILTRAYAHSPSLIGLGSLHEEFLHVPLRGNRRLDDASLGQRGCIRNGLSRWYAARPQPH